MDKVCMQCGAPVSPHSKKCEYCNASILQDSLAGGKQEKTSVEELPQEVYADEEESVERPLAITITCVVAWLILALELIGHFTSGDELYSSRAEARVSLWMMFFQIGAMGRIWTMVKSGVYTWLALAVVEMFLCMLFSGEFPIFDLVLYVLLSVAPLYYLSQMQSKL